MFNTKVVFVVGAGASKEAEFPLGTELKHTIRSLLNIRYADGYSQSSGDHVIADAMRLYANEHNEGNLNPWRQAGIQIGTAMPLALSIDNYLHAHQHNPHVVLAGKLAIARSILSAEANSPLYDGGVRNAAFEKLQTTWFAKFFQLLTANVPLADVKGIFQNVSVITFNYDRSLEQFLIISLQKYYSIARDLAEEIVGHLRVFHPYGAVGKLSQGSMQVPFGGSDDAQELLSIASEIQTFSETASDFRAIEEIKSWLSESQAVVFLGFAFHTLNMNLLTIPGSLDSARQVFATAYGVSGSDCAIIQTEIVNRLRCYRNRVHVIGGLSCSGMFDDHWRAFNAL